MNDDAAVRDAARGSAAHVLVADLAAPELDDADRHHLLSVLRLRAGEELSATDGAGGWRLCHLARDGLLKPAGDAVHLEKPAPAITVAFAPVKGDRPEWAVQKLCEVGVDRIVLLETARSVVVWKDERAQRNLDRLRVVARQALMQSRRLWLASVEGVVTFDAAAEWPGVALAAPGGSPPDLGHPTVLVGPEGGWSQGEESGELPLVDLGPTVLRTESAAVSAGVLLSALRAGLVRPA